MSTMPKLSNKAAQYSHARSKKFIKGDKVIVITGSDKGNVSEIIKVYDRHVIVADVNKKTKTQKSDGQNNGGFVQVERPIDTSNILIYNTLTQKPDRVSFKFIDGKKVRVYKSSGEPIQVSKVD
jgi:large subunit ribosomal protein L24